MQRSFVALLIAVAACRSSVEQENAALRARVEQLGRESAEMDARLVELEKALDETRQQLADRPRLASARVIETWSEEPEIVISMGATEHVRVGDVFHVLTGPKSVVAIEVTKVESDRSVALPAERDRRAHVGDRVYTPLESQVELLQRRKESIRSMLRKAHQQGLVSEQLDPETMPDPDETLVERRDRLVAELDGLFVRTDRARTSRRRLLPPEAPTGRILFVHTGRVGTLVTISIGSDDDVRRGDEYHIRRGSSYVGMMKVDRVDPNESVGLYDDEFPGGGAPPRPGDVAYPAAR